MADTLRIRDDLVTDLRKDIADGEFGLAHVPSLLKKIIREDCWRERIIVQTGELVKFDRFADFVSTKPLGGLGEDLETLKRLCRDDAEALDLLDSVTTNPKHKHVDNNNVIISEQGNGKQYALRKLRKDAPEIHAQVLAGELSPHAGMVKAGFRKRPTRVQSAQKFVSKMTEAELKEFGEWFEKFCFS